MSWPASAAIRVWVLVLSLLLSGSALAAREGSTGRGSLEEVTFWSPTLGEEARFRVYLPPSFERDGPRQYAVIYLLHGMGGSSWDWLYLGKIGAALDRRAAAMARRGVIAIAPNGASSYWTRQVDRVHRSGQDMARYIALDLVAQVEARYPVLRRRAHRAIVGNSMGGFGALSIALLYPDRFAAAVSLSGSIFPGAPSHKRVYHSVWGDPPNERFFSGSSPTQLIESLPRDHPWPHLWIGCGRSDLRTYKVYASVFREALSERGIPHENVDGPGGHGWAYWVGQSKLWLDPLLKLVVPG